MRHFARALLVRAPAVGGAVRAQMNAGRVATS